MLTLLVLGALCAFGAVVLAAYAVTAPSQARLEVSRSLAFVDRAGVRAARGVSPQDGAFGDRVLAPLYGHLASLARRLSPVGVSERIGRRLDMAGNPSGWTADRIFAYKGLGLIVSGALGLAIGLGGGPIRLLVAVSVFSAAGFFLPDILLYNAGLKRQAALRKAIPDALDLLTVCVEAGLGFDAALAQVARNTQGPLSGEFFRVLQEMQIGKSRTEAFSALGERTTVAELRTFVAALVQADGLGIPIARVLREQSKEMRVKRHQLAEEKAHKVPVKILIPMMLFILPALFVVVIGPGALSIMGSLAGNM